MSVKIPRRAVVSTHYESGGRYGKETWYLNLSCGHRDVRYCKPPWWKTPKTSNCYKCYHEAEVKAGRRPATKEETE